MTEYSLEQLEGEQMAEMVAGGRLAHVAIRARDAEATRRFYEQGVGLRFLGYRRPGSQSFDLSDGGLNVTVIPYEGPARDAHEEGTEHIHIGFLVPNAAEAYERLRAVNAAFLRNDVKVRDEHVGPPLPDGSFKVADPDGNVVDVTGNPAEWRQ
jgi:catechol 2,3-dioxygenase-like lactoylglutathione lyase family enzyme